MKQPTFCLVIPCRDDADLLGPCLESFTRQSVALDGIVVVDNDSSDNSAEVARHYGAHVVHEPRVGITWAASAGYDAAADMGYDIIWRTDADSYAHPDSVLQLHRLWQHRSGRGKKVVGYVGAASFSVPLVGALLGSLYLGAYRHSVSTALGHQPLFGSNCSFTTEWWASVRNTVDVTDTFAHDDIQLSFSVRPDETVLYSRRPRLVLDPRALKGASQLRRRFTRGWHSMMRGFEVSPPPRRLLQRLRPVD